MVISNHKFDEGAIMYIIGTDTFTKVGIICHIDYLIMILYHQFIFL